MEPSDDSRRLRVLDEVLHAIRLRSAVYCRARMSGIWGFCTEPKDHARFHFISSGKCWAEVAGSGDPILLRSGDLIIFTRGQAHIMRNRRQSPFEMLPKLLEKRPLDPHRNFSWENGRERITMLCGGFHLEETKTNPVLDLLPEVMIIRAESEAGVPLMAAFELVEAELASGRPGAEAVVSRLSDVILLQSIRTSLTSQNEHVPGLILALTDPLIGKAIVAIHRRLQRPWTVEFLARQLGMSRSAFAARFAELVGEPPMSYLTRWRLNRAAYWLGSSDAKIMDVAARVGYQSEVSLSRAFKRCFGLSPGAYRRRHTIANNPATVSPHFESGLTSSIPSRGKGAGSDTHLATRARLAI